MHKTIFTTVFLLLLAFALPAQCYLDEYSIQDSTMKAVIAKKMKVFKMFEEGRLDSLYSALGNDSTIIKRDTLQKCYRLYSEKYQYADSVSNPAIWSISSTGNTLNRTFVGVSSGVVTGSGVRQTALQMHVDFKIEKGVVRISRITFMEVPISTEANKHVVEERSSRSKKQVKEKVQGEIKKNEQKTKEQLQKSFPPR